ncbi:hypothetical protein AbraIFM66951_003730 [Aspergillus brasiliensis]|uniref:Uncharacterized protein n=1 Tax=Aspergillus brasiliensis TaxID=319629 RepID=A0A9W5YNY9_9EURO|nr:hypothetical protein AbraCBS73388_004551 [Aspergillus brasiliensis]GKZ43176.1 hypothetical protein AbraIFM66951_003730 [Aspergillus brasiliensis]
MRCRLRRVQTSSVTQQRSDDGDMTTRNDNTTNTTTTGVKTPPSGQYATAAADRPTAGKAIKRLSDNSSGRRRRWTGRQRRTRITLQRVAQRNTDAWTLKTNELA